jgi:hypothetical protein
MKRKPTKRAGVSQLAEETDSKPVQCGFDSHRQHFYAYMLSMYLGDGHITQQPRTCRLRIFLDNKYPNIIEECVQSLSSIFPDNKVSIYKPGRFAGNCSVVVVHSQSLPELFPQHGPGPKEKSNSINGRKKSFKIVPSSFSEALYIQMDAAI